MILSGEFSGSTTSDSEDSYRIFDRILWIFCKMKTTSITVKKHVGTCIIEFMHRSCCWWNKSCIIWNPANNGTITISPGAGFLPSTVWCAFWGISLCIIPQKVREYPQLDSRKRRLLLETIIFQLPADSQGKPPSCKTQSPRSLTSTSSPRLAGLFMAAPRTKCRDRDQLGSFGN